MITEAAVLLRDEIRNYLRQAGAVSQDDDVLLGNIASLENETALSDKVIISLVNVEEESALKNNRNWTHNPITGGIETAHPPVHLNLYLLFTATHPQNINNDEPYQKALGRIGTIVEFFQSKKVFTFQSSPALLRTFNERVLNEIRLVPELYTLTFEQINHLWGSLGGKQSPFVMYKIRLVRIQGRITAEAPPIESIKGDVHSTHAN